MGLASVLAAIAMGAGTAQASTVLRVGHGGRITAVRDPLLPPAAATRLPQSGRARTVLALPSATAPVVAVPSDVEVALADARAARDALPSGPARTELTGVIANAEALIARGELTPSRAPATLMTLRRNTQFFARNAPPPAGARVTFTGSPVIFEHYPGEGLQIQPLAGFGKANAAWRACKSTGNTTCTALRSMLDAMIGLAAQRGSFRAWEYLFDFEGGTPPWTSAMSQGTGIQALSRAYDLTGEPRYKAAAAAAVGAFETPPPLGVAVPATGGTHFLMYSYAPDLVIFNGFLQSLTGLDDYRDFTGDPRGTTLFRAGHGNAKAIVPLSDTGTWSRYSLGGPLSTVEYHTLLRDVLDSLCHRQGSAVYCDTAARFTTYLTQPPAPR